jgi:hypothetical protein
MILGGIAEKAFSIEGFDFTAELEKEGFTPDYVRILQDAVKNMPRYKDNNIKVGTDYFLDGKKIRLYGVFDAIDNEIIIERKFGTVWNQTDVQNSIQLSFYWLLYLLKNGKEPKKIILYSCNSKNGKVIKYETTRSQNDIEKLNQLILFAWNGITNQIYEHNYVVPRNNIWLK